MIISRVFARIIPAFVSGKRFGVSLLVFFLLFVARNCFALGQTQYVETISSENAFPLVQNQSAADLVVDTNDFPGVLIAANNLQKDISRVSGIVPRLVN